MKCDLIRACAGPHMGILEQISATGNDGQRTSLGNSFTAKVAACLNAQGTPCTQISADKIDFGSGIVYDIIENLHGTKGSEAKLSCHHVTGGEGGAPPPPPPPGPPIQKPPPGNGNGDDFLKEAEKYLPWIAAGVLLLQLRQ